MTDHDTNPGAPNLRLPILAAILEHAGDALDDIATLLRNTDRAAGRVPEPEPADAPSVARFTWTPAFASAVKPEAVIRIDGRYVDDAPGMRAFRVTEKRDGERTLFGNTQQTVTLLLMDLDSGVPRSISTVGDTPLEVGVEVPADLAEMPGGAA